MSGAALENATPAHTAGPWKVARPYDDIPSVMTLKDEPICDVYEHGAPGGQYNAALIAAAPDLLAACEDALKKLEVLSGEGVVKMPLTIAILKAAIERATA